MTEDEKRKTPSAEKHEPGETSTRESRDRDSVRLVGTAVLVILIGGAAFLAADTYHINVAWVFLSWNSIWFFVALRKGFRRHFRNAKFTAFLLLWMVIHGTVVVLLMRWVRLQYWTPLMALELLVGFLAADLLFGIRPDLKKRGLD